MTSPVSLAPLAPEHDAPLRKIRVKDHQVVFTGHPSAALDTPEDGVDLHVILQNGTVVGMFRADTTYHLRHTFAPSDSLGIRAFIIDQDLQGAGLGKATCRVMASYLRSKYPLKTAAYLTVNTRNANALRAYIKGGWTDTGALHLLGAAGPQHILRLPLF